MKTLKIAILGAGFSGMAAAYFLTESQRNLEISLIDPGEIGENASGISAGLLHPYPGIRSKLVANGLEGYKASLKLLKVASDALGVPIAKQTGMLRIALTEQQESDFKNASSNYNDIKWCDVERCQKIGPGLSQKPGIFIESAYVVKTKLYLEGLWRYLNQKGVFWIKKKVNSLAELSDFDSIIVTAGANTIKIPELGHVPITPLKGQILEIYSRNAFDIPLSGSAYLVPGNKPHTYFFGATFERNYDNDQPNSEIALQDLQPKWQALFPSAEPFEVLNCYAGLRASAPAHLPLIQRVGEKTWVFSGMGSKGLLYHALYAKELISRMGNS